MAKITKMPGTKVISGFKGTLDYYYYMGIACVRSWPRSPGKIRSPAVMAQWQIFINASSLWNQISPSVREAYEQMAVSTSLTPRDMFTRGYISGTLRYYIAVDELEEPP